MLVTHWAEDIACATNDGTAVTRLAIGTGSAIISSLDAFGGHISPLMVGLARNGRRRGIVTDGTDNGLDVVVCTATVANVWAPVVINITGCN
jgi:hypothetical protein